MSFKRGEKVVIRNNLGAKNFGSKFSYYYGGSVKDVPLGTKAVIERVFGSSKVKIKLVGGYNQDKIWSVHPSELSLSKEQRQVGKGFDSLLDDLLLGEPIKENKTRRKTIPFKPKFNAKEEFPVWVRDQFPSLKKYARTKQAYAKLSRRIDEVKEAAQTAWKGVQRSTTLRRDRYCHRNFLKPKFTRFYNAAEPSQENKREYVAALENLVRAIEVSRMQGFPYIRQAEYFRGVGKVT